MSRSPVTFRYERISISEAVPMTAASVKATPSLTISIPSPSMPLAPLNRRGISFSDCFSVSTIVAKAIITITGTIPDSPNT